MNDIIGKLNVIIECFNFKGIPTLAPVAEKACTPATLCTGGEDLKLTLKGNRKICLSCSHPDLNGYSHEELHQIMYGINTIQCKNNKFAHLKKCVSDKLSEHNQCKPSHSSHSTRKNHGSKHSHSGKNHGSKHSKSSHEEHDELPE